MSYWNRHRHRHTNWVNISQIICLSSWKANNKSFMNASEIGYSVKLTWILRENGALVSCFFLSFWEKIVVRTDAVLQFRHFYMVCRKKGFENRDITDTSNHIFGRFFETWNVNTGFYMMIFRKIRAPSTIWCSFLK